MKHLSIRPLVSCILAVTLFLTLPAHKAYSQRNYDLHELDPSKLLDCKGGQFEKYQKQSPAIEFAGRAIFDSAIFSDTMDLSQAQFDTASYFSYVRFWDTTSFAYATFIGITNFGASQFDTASTFNGADFQDTALFRSDNFIGPCRFTDATFESGSLFSGSSFQHGAWFDNVTFKQVAYFENTRFSGYTKFTNLTFLDSAYIDFSNAHLPDTLDLSNNGSFRRIVDLTTANFIDSPRYDRRSGDYAPHYIYLYRTDISKIHLDYEHFRLLLPDTALSPDAFGLFQPISVDEKEAMYEALLNNFKLSGQAESFRYLDIEYQKFRWWHSWARLFIWVPYTWNYFGYEKELIFAWIVLLIVLFTIINYKCLDLLNGTVYHVLDLKEKAALLPWKKRMHYAFLYTTNIFFPLKLELKNLDFGKVIPTAYVLFMYVMGILCLGYLANFILQK